MDHFDMIVICGATGVVGSQLARLVFKRHPTLKLVLGTREGKDSAVAQSIVKELGGGGQVDICKIDLGKTDPLEELVCAGRAIVVALCNDPFDYLLLSATKRGFALIDVTRWDPAPSRAKLVVEDLKAPVIFSSGWMGGMPACAAQSLQKEFVTIDSVNISVLYALADRAGPNSVAYMDRLDQNFVTLCKGKLTEVHALIDPKSVDFGEEGKKLRTVYRFDTPDQTSLARTMSVTTDVASRIAFDDAFSTWLLSFLVRYGIWNLFSQRIRRAILYNPGKGGTHRVLVEVSGVGKEGQPLQREVLLVDSLGQSHLTAVGALLQVERLLVWSSTTPLILDPQSIMLDHPQSFQELCAAEGVQISTNKL